MAIIESVKKIFSKVLSIGKPSEDDVLYSKVIKKEMAQKSAEKVTESSIAVPAPPVKKTPTKKITKKKPVVKKAVAKKATVKKIPAKKPVTKKAAEKKSTETKSTTVKKAAAPKGAKKAEKIALYIQDIKKHYGEVDEDFVAVIVKNLGPSIYKRDAELVSCSDPKELDTVRKSFLMKKLGIDASQGVLDAAIADVCEELNATRTKYRATFYYALAKKFKKESVLS